MLYICATLRTRSSTQLSFLVQSAKLVLFPSLLFCFPPLILVLVDTVTWHIFLPAFALVLGLSTSRTETCLVNSPRGPLNIEREQL